MKSILGWSVSKKPAGYDCGFAPLSEDEEDFLVRFTDKFTEYSKSKDVSDFEVAKKAIEELLKTVLEEEGLETEPEQFNYLAKAALFHIAGFAPLDKMLSDPNIEEVAVYALNKPVMVYIRKKGWTECNCSITSLDYLIHLINKIGRQLGRRITAQSPRLNAVLASGHRLHASIPPISEGEMTIRLHSSKPWSIVEILQSGSTSSNILGFLWLVFQSDSSVLVVGNTASGKTTLLNSLFSFVPLWERVIIIEDTPEIKIEHKHKINLIANEDLNISIADLVRDSLRMRPDRVIAGEIRTKAEVEALVETLLSGQARGSYATFHAQSAVEALKRLENLGASADDLKAIDFIIVQRRISKYDKKTKKQQEVRRMIGVYMIDKEKDRPAVLEIFSYEPKTDKFIQSKNLNKALELIAKKLGLDVSSIKSLYKERIKFLESLKAEDCLKKIQEFAYGEIH
ncbi:MAG: ATPase, T2SS/T4P/T4SS family [Candidatus Micrarchaeota archaeon]|nr:ATPase, T2SS/T4P/T4SS family [Candidatus Micrarchaeota archaeon]